MGGHGGTKVLGSWQLENRAEQHQRKGEGPGIDTKTTPKGLKRHSQKCALPIPQEDIKVSQVNTPL